MGQDESAWLDDLFHHAAHSLGDAHVPATRSPTRRTQNRSEARPPPLNPPRNLPSTRHRKQSLPISRTGLPSAALPATKSYHPQPRVPAPIPPPFRPPRTPHHSPRPPSDHSTPTYHQTIRNLTLLAIANRPRNNHEKHLCPRNVFANTMATVPGSLSPNYARTDT